MPKMTFFCFGTCTNSPPVPFKADSLTWILALLLKIILLNTKSQNMQSLILHENLPEDILARTEELLEFSSDEQIHRIEVANDQVEIPISSVAAQKAVFAITRITSHPVPSIMKGFSSVASAYPANHSCGYMKLYEQTLTLFREEIVQGS